MSETHVFAVKKKAKARTGGRQKLSIPRGHGRESHEAGKFSTRRPVSCNTAAGLRQHRACRALWDITA